jgi:L-2-hydroxyglutarate oxidase LhgO
MLCVRGRRMLYRYCDDRRVPYRRCGKLVVATDQSEDACLSHLRQRAKTNGVEEVELIGAARLKGLEPRLRATSALLSPCSGIVDSHALMLSYQADAEAAGGTIVFRTPVVAATIAGRTIQLETAGSESAELEADLVVNAAGLDAWDFSARLSGLTPTTIPPKFLAKGNYFTLTGANAPFRHLVYPVPEPGGLGIHLTLDLAGQARFGPDVEWVDSIDYAVDPDRGHCFYAAIRRYWPDLPDGALVSAYSGIRPKTAASGPGDFIIQGQQDTGHKAYIALYGIESPGLTASLAIGERVTQLAGIV